MRSDIARLLKQRGHDVVKEGGPQDILLPRLEMDQELKGSFEVILYNLMRHDEYRKSLRDWAFGNKTNLSEYSRCVEAYLTLCTQFGGLRDGNVDARQMRYAKTFEWFISELLRREFAARASGFSLRLKDADPGDEFDCIGLLDEGLVFVECKTGKKEIYTDVAKFMRRDVEINGTYSFYLFDRDYAFQKEGDDLPEISRTRAQKLGILGIFQVSVRAHKFFEIQSVPGKDGGRYLLACSAFDGLEDRIRYMIRYCNDDRNEILSKTLYKREEIFCYGVDPKSIE